MKELERQAAKRPPGPPESKIGPARSRLRKRGLNPFSATAGYGSGAAADSWHLSLVSTVRRRPWLQDGTVGTPKYRHGGIRPWEAWPAEILWLACRPAGLLELGWVHDPGLFGRPDPRYPGTDVHVRELASVSGRVERMWFLDRAEPHDALPHARRHHPACGWPALN